MSSGALANGPTVQRLSPGPDMSMLMWTYSLQSQMQGKTKKAKNGDAHIPLTPIITDALICK